MPKIYVVEVESEFEDELERGMEFGSDTLRDLDGMVFAYGFSSIKILSDEITLDEAGVVEVKDA